MVKNIEDYMSLIDYREDLSKKIDKIYHKIFDLNTCLDERKKLIKKFDKYIGKYLILCKEIDNYIVLA